MTRDANSLISGTTSFDCLNPHCLNIFFNFIDDSQITKAESIHVFQFAFKFFNVIWYRGFSEMKSKAADIRALRAASALL